MQYIQYFEKNRNRWMDGQTALKEFSAVAITQYMYMYLQLAPNYAINFYA